MYYYFMLGLWLTMSCYAASSEEIVLKQREGMLQSQCNQQRDEIQAAYLAFISAPRGSIEASHWAQRLRNAEVEERKIAQQLAACRKLLDTYAKPDKRLQPEYWERLSQCNF